MANAQVNCCFCFSFLLPGVTSQSIVFLFFTGSCLLCLVDCCFVFLLFFTGWFLFLDAALEAHWDTTSNIWEQWIVFLVLIDFILVLHRLIIIFSTGSSLFCQTGIVVFVSPFFFLVWGHTIWKISWLLIVVFVFLLPFHKFIILFWHSIGHQELEAESIGLVFCPAVDCFSFSFHRLIVLSAAVACTGCCTG